jgi:hypothetical protein
MVQLPVPGHAGARWHEDLDRQAQLRRDEWERTVADRKRRAKEHAKRQEEDTKPRIEADREARRANFGPTPA